MSKNNADKQYVWESTAQNEFTIIEDPRGETLGRGTQIVLHLRDDATEEFLPQDSLKQIIERYSEFVNFPIYLEMERTEEKEEPLDVEEVKAQVAAYNERKAEREKQKEAERQAKEEARAKAEDEGAEIEDVAEEEEKPEEPEKEIKTTHMVKRNVTEWTLMNPLKPIWTRDSKEVTEEEYHKFYKSFTKEKEDPMAYSHFKAEGELEFRSILYIPSKSPVNLLQSADAHIRAIKLFVRRVFISDELVDFIPRYLNFLKGLVDSDDLPLNVSRESLQEGKLLKMIKRKVIRKALDLVESLSQDEKKYAEFLKEFGGNIKLGVIEDRANQKKLLKLLRYPSTATEGDKTTSLEDYVERMKKGQDQIYYLTGPTLDEIKKSPFLERVTARGYEVIFMADPIDEYVVQNVHEFDDKPLQNVAKDGLKLGDDDQKEQDKFMQRFAPLSMFLTMALSSHNLEKVVVSNRLTTSPCAIVAAKYGWSGNMERMMNSQAFQSGEDHMRIFQSLQKKIFEINPRHPIMEKLLDLVEKKQNEEATEAAQILYETTALRSGFMLKDTTSLANLVDKLLRKNLGVDLKAEVG